MSIDIESELRAAMTEATSDVVASPDLLARLRIRPRRRMPPRLAVVVAAMAVAVTVVGAFVLAPRSGSGPVGSSVRPLSAITVAPANPGAVRAAAAQMSDAIANWGSTRGDLASDSAFIADLKAQWAHPSGREQDIAGFTPVVMPDGPVQVLWAGTTPQGEAAFAVQHTEDPVATYWYGVYIAGPNGRAQLFTRNQLTADAPAGDPSAFDPNVISFVTSRADRAVVVLPSDPSTRVRVSFSHSLDASGQATPSWQDVATTNGAAVVALPADASSYGAVVEVSRDGHVVADQHVDVRAGGTGFTRPANDLGLWCNGCAVDGSGELSSSLAMLRAWTVRHAPAYLPTYGPDWTVGARLPDGGNVLAGQLWLEGDPAHTVVLATSADQTHVDVLYDVVTDPRTRPAFAVRLPQAAGWLVGAGPRATITGWRAPGDMNWTSVSNEKAALLPTDAATIELRLLVDGQQRVVTP
jgi:hypothetical protein